MALPKVIPKRVYQAIGVSTVLGCVALTVYWGATFSGPWAAIAGALSYEDGTYELTLTALLTFLGPLLASLVVLLPLRAISDMPSPGQQLGQLGTLLGGQRPGAVTGAVPGGGEAATPDPTLASAGRRIAALLIDRLLLIPLCLAGFMPAMLFEPSDRSAPRVAALVLALVTLLAVVVYAWARDAWRGRSVGRWLLGIRVVDASTREPIGAWRSLKRELPLHVSPLPFLELALLLTRKDRRRLGDQWAKTIVVRTDAPARRAPGAPSDPSPAGAGWGQQPRRPG